MAPPSTKQHRPRQTKGVSKVSKGLSKAQQLANEIDTLEESIKASCPAAGTASFTNKQPDQGDASNSAAKTFAELPLSRATQSGLRHAKYTRLTAIQRATLAHALAGRDILGAAKTGSGKTLAFLIPVIEKLFRARWDRVDGLGAIVLTPTRELAMQIFEELRKIGRCHSLSAGLLIGGKNVQSERDVVTGINVLVATPGRLLQHMDETPGFDAGGLQVLVLDEADRILDMGFRATVDAIILNLPQQRQTLLFSATQTKSVRDLARLSLRDPEYIAVHAEAGAPTPVKLQQAVMVVPLHQKLDALWSFIKTHLRGKVLVFVSTCKQARFYYEALRRLRPGVPLRVLHGKMKQMRRLTAFYEFCEAKSMVMFATDIAARGLDFPSVDWVVQMDCPEDTEAYIHRVGRTARYVSGGKALLLLIPSEQAGMMAALEGAGIPVKVIRMNPEKGQKIGPALQALCSKDAELKDMAQRAVTSYIKSYFLQPARAVFDVKQLPLLEYANSVGLLAPPRLRFLPRSEVGRGNPGRPVAEASSGDEEGRSQSPDSDRSRPDDQGSKPSATQNALKSASTQQRPISSTPSKDGIQLPALRQPTASEQLPQRSTDAITADVAISTKDGHDGPACSDSDSEGSGLLVVKKRNVLGGSGSNAPSLAEVTTHSGKKRKRLRIRPNAGSGSRVLFDEDGRQLAPLEALAMTEREASLEPTTAEERFAAAAAAMRAVDSKDLKAITALRRQKRTAKKVKQRTAAREDSAAGGMLVSGRPPRDADAAGSASDDEIALQDRTGRQNDSARTVHSKDEVAHSGMVRKTAGPTMAQQEALALSLLTASHS